MVHSQAIQRSGSRALDHGHRGFAPWAPTVPIQVIVDDISEGRPRAAGGRQRAASVVTKVATSSSTAAWELPDCLTPQGDAHVAGGFCRVAPGQCAPVLPGLHLMSTM